MTLAEDLYFPEKDVLSSPGRVWPGRMKTMSKCSKHTPEYIVLKPEKSEQLRGMRMSAGQARPMPRHQQSSAAPMARARWEDGSPPGQSTA